MNQWIQKQPIKGADLKAGDGGGGDVCAPVCSGGGGWGATMRSLVAGNGEQART